MLVTSGGGTDNQGMKHIRKITGTWRRMRQHEKQELGGDFNTTTVDIHATRLLNIQKNFHTDHSLSVGTKGIMSRETGSESDRNWL